jgi:hypothetical protein
MRSAQIAFRNCVELDSAQISIASKLKTIERSGPRPIEVHGQVTPAPRALGPCRSKVGQSR